MGALKTVTVQEGELLPLIRGVLHPRVSSGVVHLHRLDPRFASRIPTDFLRLIETQGAGASLSFRTSAAWISLIAQTLKVQAKDAPADPPHPFVATVDGNEYASFVPGERGFAYLDPLTGSAQAFKGQPFRWVIDDLPAGEKTIDLWFPYDEGVRLLALEADAEILPTASKCPQWIHYGSSISHGAVAAGTLDIWPVLAAEKLGLSLVNLGLSGNAVLDPFVAQTIAGAGASLVTLKVGINVVNNDCLTSRTFGPALHGFLDIVRAAHPQVPIVLITALACPLIEELPGPTVVEAGADGTPHFVTRGTESGIEEGRLSLAATREQIQQVYDVRSDDKIYLINGLDLLGLPDLDVEPLPDAIHPNTAHHRLIAERFANKIDLLGVVAG